MGRKPYRSARRVFLIADNGNQRAAKPFKWTFTRRDLHRLLTKLNKCRPYAGEFRQRHT